MSTESTILTLLSIIGCLVGALIIYFVANTNNQFRDIKGWIGKLSDKFDKHVDDCNLIKKGA